MSHVESFWYGLSVLDELLFFMIVALFCVILVLYLAVDHGMCKANTTVCAFTLPACQKHCKYLGDISGDDNVLLFAIVILMI